MTYLMCKIFNNISLMISFKFVQKQGSFFENRVYLKHVYLFSKKVFVKKCYMDIYYILFLNIFIGIQIIFSKPHKFKETITENMSNSIHYIQFCNSGSMSAKISIILSHLSLIVSICI